MTNQLAMFIPLLKVDEVKREVWGRATQEVMDGVGEIMDYATSKPYFTRWSAMAKERSKGKSQGNIRAMHQPVAAGKVIALDFNDAQKAVDIGTYISDDAEWKKVLDGTYTGFSVGGNYAKRWHDGRGMRYTADPHEISLVDAPAVPTATFELIKADGSSEMKKFAPHAPNAEPTDVQVEVHKALLEVAPLTQEGADTVINNFYGTVHIGKEGIQKFDDIDNAVDRLNPALADPQVPDTYPNHEVEIEEGVTEGAKNTEDDAYNEVTSGAVVKPVDPNQPNGVVETRLQDGNTVKTAASQDIDEASVEREPIPHDEETEEEAEHGGKDFSKQLAQLETFVKQFSASVEALEKFRKEESERLQKVDAELKLRGSRVGIARREGEPFQPLKDQPADWMQYADPANWSFAMTKALSGEGIATYNAGKGREKYAASEWMVLGRRIARMASDALGVPYKFSPTDRQVRRSMEKTMTDNLKKASDPMALLADVNKQLNEAVALIGTDPSAAQNMLTQVLGVMDTTSIVSPANPASGNEPPLDNMTKADTSMKCAKCGGMVAKGDKFCAACGQELQKVAQPNTPATEQVAKEDDVNDLEKAAIEKAAVEKYIAEQDAVKKAAAEKEALEKAQAEAVAKAQSLEEMVKAQSELLAKMQANIEAIAKGQPVTPAGDLAGIVPMREEENPLLKALNEGNLAKAYEVVGNDNVKLYDQVNALAVQQLYNTGINVSRFGFFPAFQAEEPKPQ